jgi:hypothetical protein
MNSILISSFETSYISIIFSWTGFLFFAAIFYLKKIIFLKSFMILLFKFSVFPHKIHSLNQVIDSLLFHIHFFKIRTTMEKSFIKIKLFNIYVNLLYFLNL